MVSVSPEPRSQFEAYQPTSVLVGQELGKQLQMSLGATLENQPGVAARSFGPAPVAAGDPRPRRRPRPDPAGRPAHGRSVEPVRRPRRHHQPGGGPADRSRARAGDAALWGERDRRTGQRHHRGHSDPRHRGRVGQRRPSISDPRPTKAAAPAAVRAGNGRVALHAGGGGRRSGDVATPEGDLVNSQSRNGFGNLGASWTGSRGYLGGSYGYDDTKYGIPVVEEGSLQLTPRRHDVHLPRRRAGSDGRLRVVPHHAGDPPLQARRARRGGGRHRVHEQHDRSRGPRVAPRRTAGSRARVGAWFMDRAFDAVGAEALSPAVDQNATAALRLRRADVAARHGPVRRPVRSRALFDPFGEDERVVHDRLGIGRPAVPSGGGATMRSRSRSASRARRAYPALEELFYFGPHPGNFAFEIGNPGLKPEHALGFDGRLRWRSAARVGRDHVLPQRHQRLRVPEPADRGRVRSAPGRVRRAVPRARHRRRTRRSETSSRSSSTSAPTASCRGSRRTRTFS